MLPTLAVLVAILNQVRHVGGVAFLIEMLYSHVFVVPTKSVVAVLPQRFWAYCAASSNRLPLRRG